MFLSVTRVAFGYPYSVERWRMYHKQQYYNKQTQQIETYLFNDYAERNKHMTEKYVCIQPDANKPGYLYVIYTSGRITMQYQTDNYSYYEGIKCDSRYDKYPNFKTKKDAQNYYK